MIFTMCLILCGDSGDLKKNTIRVPADPPISQQSKASKASKVHLPILEKQRHKSARHVHQPTSGATRRSASKYKLIILNDWKNGLCYED
jgi:hypothetical protein